MPKFILPEVSEGIVVISDRYRFVDGVMPASTADAPLLAKILCEYHGCKLVYEDVEEKSDASKEAASGSLSVDVTKTDVESKVSKEAKPAK